MKCLNAPHGRARDKRANFAHLKGAHSNQLQQVVVIKKKKMKKGKKNADPRFLNLSDFSKGRNPGFPTKC